MAKTLSEIREQIAKLQVREAKLVQAEANEVIERIKVAIKAYGFTPEQLFGAAYEMTPATASAEAPAPAPAPAPKASAAKRKLSAKAKFSDGTGNEWVGRGPRPAWLRDALTAGKTLSDFAVDRKASKPKPAPDTQP